NACLALRQPLLDLAHARIRLRCALAGIPDAGVDVRGVFFGLLRAALRLTRTLDGLSCALLCFASARRCFGDARAGLLGLAFSPGGPLLGLLCTDFGLHGALFGQARALVGLADAQLEVGGAFLGLLRPDFCASRRVLDARLELLDADVG